VKVYGLGLSGSGSGPEAGCCEHGNELQFHKMLGISCLIEQHFASQEGLGFVEIVVNEVG
jgi:hypothetical protein